MDDNTYAAIIFIAILAYAFLVQFIDIILKAIVTIAVAGGIAISIKIIISRNGE